MTLDALTEWPKDARQRPVELSDLGLHGYRTPKMVLPSTRTVSRAITISLVTHPRPFGAHAGRASRYLNVRWPSGDTTRSRRAKGHGVGSKRSCMVPVCVGKVGLGKHIHAEIGRV